ncbi:carboxymuconolactone decarboxylase family protein [Georgenia subflava]|uniref:Carboxymuconolactone decarboxylase family protein n=2 Tax=Georgenia subflava TaxID=1622177 RepID=A0A6N7EIK0_9MICO|nr:carboxymuconolactone decarboxylase family protein [Georgenia subflava]
MAAERQGVSRRLMELVNVRASQLNGCARCLDEHIPRALEAGETIQRIGVLPAWRETRLFDEVERAALEITESVTQDSGHLADDDRRRLREVLGDERFSLVAWIAITINSYNRVSILSGHQPRHRD